jgi:hypothetical protein
MRGKGEMRTERRWLARVAALLGLLLTVSTGCQTWYGGMTLPSGRYLEHFPQYIAPDPVFPLPRELASQEDPEGIARGGLGIGGGGGPIAPPPPVPADGGPR